MDFKLFHSFIKKIFNSKPAFMASKCDIGQKCNISLSKTLMKVAISRKIRAYRLLVKLILVNTFSNKLCSLLILSESDSYWPDYLRHIRSLSNVKNMSALGG